MRWWRALGCTALFWLGFNSGQLGLAEGAGEAEGKSELSQAGVQAAFQILRRDFIRSRELTPERLSKVGLEGLLTALDVGAQVVPMRAESKERKVKPGVHSMALAEAVGWVRPMSFQREEVAMVEKALNQFQVGGCEAVILDLRSPAAEGEFEVAAALVDFFVPSGESFFRLRQAGATQGEVFVSSRAAVWTGDVLVLVDERTNNVGEAVAAVLRSLERALLVGEKTQGAAVRYQTLPLDAGHALRYASAEMLLVDGTSLYQKGLEPDFRVVFDGEARDQTERWFRQGRTRELVFEVARPRFNEAALVARRNPEIESYVKRSLGEVDAADKSPLVDPVLQRAVDMVLGGDRLKQFRLKWATAAQRAKDAEVERETEEKEKVPKGIPVGDP